MNIIDWISAPAAVIAILILLLRRPGSNNDIKLLQAEIARLNAQLQEQRQTFSDAFSAQRQEQKEDRKALISELNKNASALQQALAEQAARQATLQLQQNADARNTLREGLSENRLALERAVAGMQASNEHKLEQMRKTVDEKLEQTLQTRLNRSFQLVSERLEHVHKGLGDMQNLATGVGDLKRVLGNVKTRGILGEMQLSNLLDQLLTPDQYLTNCITVPGSNARVEFALKMPRAADEQSTVLMPIDAKFPMDAYEHLQAARETDNKALIDAAEKNLERAVRKAASDIAEKYLAPPHTTDVAVMFLPTEGLYAELLHRPGLTAALQRDHHIIVTGPVTLSAVLHTLSFGYKTMALQQRSGEIKKTLRMVKTEFEKFGEHLRKTQEKINKAGEEMDKLVGAPTRRINSKLASLERWQDEEETHELPQADDFE